MAWPGRGHAVLLRHLLYGRGVKVPERERERAERAERAESAERAERGAERGELASVVA